MSNRRRKKTREQDVTERYLAGDYDDDAVDAQERFRSHNKTAQQEKIVKSAALRDAKVQDPSNLLTGQVIQIHSLFSEVESAGKTYLCVTRKTLNKISDTSIVVGDRVRIRPGNISDDLAAPGFPLAATSSQRDPHPQAVIEEILPRQTILTRTSSFKGVEQHPIVANADQMLIVTSILQPKVKWGLVDRMIIAAQSGKLRPIVCLNKIDLAPDDADADAVLAHYRTLEITTIKTSVPRSVGLSALRSILKNKITVLAGHSGVGKSTLINAIQPALDLRTAEVSQYTDKGRHTTTSARRYELAEGGAVIDTPGVKLFGLWNVTRENLEDFFPDVAAGNAPKWRIESFNRIAEGMTRRRGDKGKSN